MNKEEIVFRLKVDEVLPFLVSFSIALGGVIVCTAWMIFHVYGGI